MDKVRYSFSSTSPVTMNTNHDFISCGVVLSGYIIKLYQIYIMLKKCNRKIERVFECGTFQKFLIKNLKERQSQNITYS